ncbi:hypothetical protein C8D88_12412 [Lentzea atacamensis]|uniref:Uncharacterized protein n=1 Tax=Lentzea atacamensis TaxID=531938 RepID=A0A316HG79_9PSEU|nr:hypothetical protein [Lentzea atacamensis]PWK79486.1 hypothetical protein C8D88_12412 [Lentzea atacamensis]
MRLVLPAVSAVLALLVLTPLLGRGFVLNYDMVFAPDQSLLPDGLGLGSALPRSVPADAVMSFATALLPGDVVQKIALLAALFAGPLGAGRLVPTNSVAIRVVAAVWYGWSAYVAERLFMGHWPYVVTYACLPWIAAAGLAVRRGKPKALPKLILACAPAVLTPTGGIIAAVLAVVCSGRRKLAVTVPVTVLLNMPWLLPSVLHPGGSLSSPDGVGAFAARAENWGSPVTSVLGLGGIWNAEVVPGSRGMPLLPVITLLSVAVALVGLRSLAPRWGLAPARSFVVLGAIGVAIAVFGTLPGGGDVLAWAVSHVPGAGLLRDSQKWAAWWALPLSLGFALGVEAAGKYLTNRTALVALAALLPLITMPDFAWAGLGRLEVVDYPADWSAVRTVLAADDGAGDVLALPMSAFRRFSWNGDRTQLDPAPRFLPRTVVIDDVVYVGGRPVSGEDGRVATIRRAMARNDDLGAFGIGWVLVEHGTPGSVDPGVLRGLREVWSGPWLTLYRVPGAIAPPPAGAPRLPVVAGDLGALAVVASSLLWLLLPAGRFRRSSHSRTVEEQACAH